MKRECWLGDLIRAVERCDGRVDTIAGMLGLGRSERPGSELSLVPESQFMDGSAVGEIPDHSAGAGSGAARVVEPELTVRSALSVMTQPAASLFRLRPGAQFSLPPPMWLDSVPLAKPEIDRISRPRRYEPLLAPQSSRASLQIALQRSVPDGPPDVRCLVELVARRNRFPADLPKTMVPTLRYGAQVLCDLTESMDPFRRDQDELVKQLRKLIGGERTDVRWFEGSPSYGCSRGASEEWGKYSLPEPGRPVLVLSSFGLGHGPGYFEIRREWSDLVATLRWRDCAVIALVPVPPARWPRWLVRLMPVVCWDRSTTAGSVVAAVRRAR